MELMPTSTHLSTAFNKGYNLRHFTREEIHYANKCNANFFRKVVHILNRGVLTLTNIRFWGALFGIKSRVDQKHDGAVDAKIVDDIGSTELTNIFIIFYAVFISVALPFTLPLTALCGWIEWLINTHVTQTHNVSFESKDRGKAYAQMVDKALIRWAKGFKDLRDQARKRGDMGDEELFGKVANNMEELHAMFRKRSQYI